VSRRRVPRIAGVTAVESGYAGGKNANPSYEDVCAGRTGRPYCRAVVAPKVAKFRKAFADRLEGRVRA